VREAAERSMNSPPVTDSTAGDAAPHPLPRGLVLAYGSGQIAEGVANYLLTAMLLFYYTSILGLSGELAGLALMVGLIFDAVTDPLVAVASDRTRSRWGRRHPYLFSSVIPLAAGLILAFRPPPFVAGQAGLFFWLLAMVVSIRAAITLFHVPHMALGAELSTDYDERTRVVTVRSAAAMVGTGAIITLYFYLLTEYESPDHLDVRLNPVPYQVHSLFAGIVAGVVVLLSALGTLRAIPWLGGPPEGEGASSLFRSAMTDMAATLRIPAFRALVVGFTLCSLSWGFSSALQTHLALYFWHVSIEAQGVAGASLMIGMMLGMGFWRNLASRWDKKPAFLMGMAFYTVFAAIGPLLKVAGFFPPEDTTAHTVAYAGVSALMAFGVASTAVLSGSMMADVTDEDELASGIRREGIFFGAHSFGMKVANGVGAAMGGILYDFVGLTKGVSPSDAPADAGPQLGLASGLLIAILVGAGTLYFRHYDLSRERHGAIRAELDARAAASEHA
jgi:GPH family glycoside/pentoside/hexuronide:cation symporter